MAGGRRYPFPPILDDGRFCFQDTFVLYILHEFFSFYPIYV